MISLKHSIINFKFHVLNAVREESIRNISSCLFAELLNLPSAILSLSSSIKTTFSLKFRCHLTKKEANLLSSVSVPFSGKEQ